MGQVTRKLPLYQVTGQVVGQLFVLMVVGSTLKGSNIIYTGASPETKLF